MIRYFKKPPLLFAQVVIGLTCLMVAGESFGQTLTDTLGREDAAKLVLEARERGDIVRGAILFHQGNINCAGCHKQTSGLAPNLSQLGDQVTDASLVESILYPSKTISKGYETQSVLTADGRVFNGVIIREASDVIVLSNPADVGKPIKIERDDVDAIRASPNSTMPDGLADALKNRDQFLDLLRYVMDVKERGPTAATNDQLVIRRQLSDAHQGRVLISELNCVACHDAGDWTTEATSLPAKQSPNLAWSASRLNPRHLAEFIADPGAIKPGTTMPHVLGHLNDEERKAAAESIVHYLISQSIPSENTEDFRLDSDATDRGFELFHQVGCVACHSPRDRLAVETEKATTSDPSIPLGDLTHKYPPPALVEFLKNPHQVRPSGRMPDMRLTHREAVDLTSYLLQAAVPSANREPNANEDSAWVVDLDLAKQGKQLFVESGCVHCHGQENSPSRADLASVPTLDAVDIQKGCLANDPGSSPQFHLTAGQQRQLRAAIQTIRQPLTDQEHIDLQLVAMNCVACHSRDDLGGVTEQRRPHFQTTNLNLGEQGRIPPTLTGVGAKLNPDWMRDVMVNGRSIRPYMMTRMPQYGEANVADLLERLQATDELAESDRLTKFAKVDDQKQAREYGHLLAGNKGLNCAACHTFQYKLADTMPAVDLTEMAERLKKDWFYEYMLQPQRFSPNTVMPSFWPGGKAIRDDLEGTSEDQIEAIWRYLLDGRQARAPAGVVREPLEIVVTGEARMLRRRYPGMASKRGIGIGYPGGVNVAFDAEQMRLAMIWKGKFVDPSGVWYGQGHGNVRPMGRPFEFPMGPELDDSSNPSISDPDDRPTKHRFRGYSLDEQRRPVIQYTFGSVEVGDYFTQTIAGENQVQLRREVALQSNEDNPSLRFRIAKHDSVVTGSNREFVVAEQLRVRILSDHSAKIVRDTEGMMLTVEMDLKANTPQQLILEYVWE